MCGANTADAPMKWNFVIGSSKPEETTWSKQRDYKHVDLQKQTAFNHI